MVRTGGIAMHTVVEPPRRAIAASTLVRDARDRAGLTQLELALRAGVTQSVVSTYENGRREPSLSMLQRLLGAAGFMASLDLEPVAVVSTIRERVQRSRREIVRGCLALGGRSVRLVGQTSARNNDEGPVEFIVELTPGTGLFALLRMQDMLEALITAPVIVTSVDSYDSWSRATLFRDAVEL
jgi:transcriptional regulator with XRE-family HTH domain